MGSIVSSSDPISIVSDFMNIGTVLVDRYQIKEQLSQKTGRKTFIALDLELQDLVIVKILTFNQEFNWDDLKLFEREAIVLQNLDNPAIPKYLNYFDIEGGFALVQTYLEARSLAEWIEQGRKFSETEVIEIAEKLLEVLAYLHSQNPPTIHRDIKPSNILLYARDDRRIDSVYLVDFGSVQNAASKEEGTMTIVGSYGYIPIEQFGGQTTPASDLYSLGMTLIYLLTGTHPAELKQSDGKIKFAADISPRFRRWLEKMTQPYPDKRFNSAAYASNDLKSDNEDLGNFTDLKPPDTNVKLYRDNQQIKIVWQDVDRERIEKANILPYKMTKSYSKGMLIAFLSGTIVVILSCIFNTTSISSIFMFGLGLTFFSLPLFLFGCILVSLWIAVEKQLISYCKVEYTCSIDNLSISLLKCVRKKHQKPLSKHDRDSIVFLAYHPSRIDIKGKGNPSFKNNSIQSRTKLSINCGKFEYSVIDLSPEESWWLGKELSDFLGLELRIVYSQ
jgi:serine/threonine protein kinase